MKIQHGIALARLETVPQLNKSCGFDVEQIVSNLTIYRRSRMVFYHWLEGYFTKELGITLWTDKDDAEELSDFRIPNTIQDYIVGRMLKWNTPYIEFTIGKDGEHTCIQCCHPQDNFTKRYGFKAVKGRLEKYEPGSHRKVFAV